MRVVRRVRCWLSVAACLLAQADLLAHGAVSLDSGLRRRELLARGIAPRSETRWLSLGQRALWRLLSAPDHAPGRPNLRPASADQPSRWLWPAIQALVSTRRRARASG